MAGERVKLPPTLKCRVPAVPRLPERTCGPLAVDVVVTAIEPAGLDMVKLGGTDTDMP